VGVADVVCEHPELEALQAEQEELKAECQASLAEHEMLSATCEALSVKRDILIARVRFLEGELERSGKGPAARVVTAPARRQNSGDKRK
jgi:hypothetical protein